MEGTVRCLLITILATAATAIYEYNNQEVKFIHKVIRKLNKMDTVKFKNMDGDVKWILEVASIQEIIFAITDQNRSSEEICGGGPALRIDNGPHHCLYGMNFLAFTVDEDNHLQIAILFRNSQDDSIIRVMLSELFKKPEIPDQDLSNVVFVEPIPRQELAKARNQESFVAPISWIRNLLEKGIYYVSFKSDEEESVEDTSDSHEVITYTTYPVVMDTDILNQILEMRFVP